MKIMVVIYGLVMFAPQGVTGTGDATMATGLDALFVNGAILGPMMEHQPTLWMVEEGGDLGGPRELDPDFAMKIDQDPDTSTSSIGLASRWMFAQLEPLMPGVTLKSTCRDNAPLCRTNSGMDMVLGKASVEGTWTTRHASVCDGVFSSPVVFADPATFSFRKTEAGHRRHDAPPFKLATALVLEADVTSLDDVLTIGGTPVSIPELDGEDCTKWIKGANPGTECGVVVLGNPPVDPMPCDSPPCRFDEHFEAFYSLVDDRDERYEWIPYVEEEPRCPRFTNAVPSMVAAPKTDGDQYSLVTPPAVRCPPVFIGE